MLTSNVGPRSFGRLLVLIALSGVVGCSTNPPPACEGEQEATTSDGRVRIARRAPVDISANGVLSGPPSVGARPMKAVLLIDFSGSMYGGYARDPIANCPACQAMATRRKKQPYFFEVPAFQTLIGDWVRAAAPPGTDLDVSVLLFNKALFDVVPGRAKSDGGVVRKIAALDKIDLATGEDADHPLPKVLAAPIHVSGHQGDVESVLKSIPKDPIQFDKKAAQETHLGGAVAAARKLLGDEGMIWLVTDNIADSPGAGSSEADVLRNLAFYRLLKEDPRLQSVFAYPLFDGEQCTFLCGTSLFVYGIHVSTKTRPDADEVNRLSGNHLHEGDAAVEGALWNPTLKALSASHTGPIQADASVSDYVKSITGVPLRLKPVDLDVISVSFERNANGRVAPLKCKKTAEFGDKVPCIATLVVRNNFRHQSVQSGTLVIENDVLLPRALSRDKDSAKRLPWAGAVCAKSVQMREIVGKDHGGDTPHNLEGRLEVPLRELRPGSERKIKLLVVVPSVAIAPTTIGEVFDTAFVDTVLLDGTIHARVENVTTMLQLSKPMAASAYGALGLPLIFRTQSQAEVRVDFPAQVPVQNDGKLRAILLFALIGLLVLVLLLVLFRFQRVRVTVLVDGVEAARLSLPRISRRKVERGATEVGSARRGAFGPVRFVPKKGIAAKRSGSAWVLSGGGLSDCRVELRNGWGGGGSRSGSRGGGGSSF